jgi:transcription elongation factor GreA
MGEDDVYLTEDGHRKLMEELDYLKTTKRRQLSEAIGHARSFGDISENAEYDAAKDAQALNEKRIAELEMKLSGAQIIDSSKMSDEEVLFGATVRLEDADTGEEIEYTLVSELEADYAQGRISVTSPVGKALIGHKLSDIVEINVPAGVLKYRVVSISR